MTTPARSQYLRIKKEHEGEILLFRMGDFYETFDDDAYVLSKELEIALTSRDMGKGNRVPLAGIPHHALEPYLSKLVAKGYRVAICEQVSDPAKSKGLVDREVVRVATRGTVIEDALLEQKTNNYLTSVMFGGDQVGLAYVDITTSEFATTQIRIEQLPAEIGRLAPAELLIPEGEQYSTDDSMATTSIDKDLYELELAAKTLLDHFDVISLEPFGCEGMPLAIGAAGSIIEYLKKTQPFALRQLGSLQTYSTATHMVLDPQTLKNLELFHGSRTGSAKGSLLSVLDKTLTPMGGRLLKKWISQPLLDVEELHQRQEVVAWLCRKFESKDTITDSLSKISDIERMVNKIRNHTATPRDLVCVMNSLAEIPRMKSCFTTEEDSLQIQSITEGLFDNKEVVTLLREAIVDDPTGIVGGGRVIRDGFSLDLDRLKESCRHAENYIAELETKERKRTGIKSLKVGYNRVFGYYIEVSNPNLAQVPDDYTRRQTLVGGERFITPGMKEYESVILNTQDKISELESRLFRQVCAQVSESADTILRTASIVAFVDVLTAFSVTASLNGFVKPLVDNSDALEITGGRHPVVENVLPSGSFVSNDTLMSNAQDQLIIITGPNMSGKSTYIRQVAIIVLMAQIGSFVPVDFARIGIVDRIFTRVGLQDDLAIGQSTFMVEMVETAFILNNASPRSLIILDEIGRGTSTYDGLAIATSVAEHIHNHPMLGCKTLFATHYHELTKLDESLPRVKNFNIAVSEHKGKIVFLRRILPGGADKSYGVHVARFAGLPPSVIHRAWEILADLEDTKNPIHLRESLVRGGNAQKPRQLAFSDSYPQAISELLDLDITAMSPLEAINKLYELQQNARDQED